MNRKLEFKVAGTKHYNYAESQKSLIPGESVKLEFEPENEYDSNAVGVWYLGTFYGYVPANLTLEEAIVNERPFRVKRLLDDTFEVEAV